MAPVASTSAATSVLTAISRSVPDKRIPLSVVSTRMLARTGRVVLAGMLAATAASPSCSFSREMVNRITAPGFWRVNVYTSCLATVLLSRRMRIPVVEVGAVENVDGPCKLLADWELSPV